MAQIAPCRSPVISHPERTSPIPAPANDVGCERGLRLEVGNVSLFRCQAVPAEGEEDIPEGSPEYAFLLDRPRQPRTILPDDLMAGRYDAFDVHVTELNGDRRVEYVLAAWNGQGNGIGINRWTIRVFDDAWTLLATYENVSDWGDSSIVAAPPSRAGCDLAITSFVDDIDARGRRGVAFQARFHRLEDGKMVEADDRPILTRRYTFAFQDQRTAHFQTDDEPIKGDVAAWLSDPSTRKSCALGNPQCLETHGVVSKAASPVALGQPLR